MQVQPVNIAVTIAVNSPGASPVIVQTNGNSAAGNAANSSSTNQSAGQSQASNGAGSGSTGQGKTGGGGGGAQSKATKQPSQTGGSSTESAPGTVHGKSGSIQRAQSQLAQQSSQTGQAAGAQATAVQVQPVNVAIPVAVNSPGASPVIVQTNVNSAAANAANSSATTQRSGQSQAAGAGSASQAGPPGGPNGLQSPLANPAIDFGGPISLPGLGPGLSLSFNWNSMSNWNLEIGIPGVQAPPMPDWQLPVPSWPFPGNDEVSHKPAARSKDDTGAGRRFDDRREPVGPTAPESSSSLELPPPVSSRFDSSSFVQRPANEQEPFIGQLIPLPRPSLPAPPGGAAGFAVSGLILGAVAILALHLAYLGLLLGRLGLASAPWRHQAYLTPLQRPG